MSGQQLQQMLDGASEFCQAQFDKCGEVVPIWHAITSDGQEVIEPHPFFLGKEIAMALIRALFDVRDVVRYVYMGEAWTLNRLIAPGEDEAIMRDGIANHPDRIEVVQLQGEDLECGQIMGQRRIIRPERGKPDLALPEMITDLPSIPDGTRLGHSSGRTVGVLRTRGTPQWLSTTDVCSGNT